MYNLKIKSNKESQIQTFLLQHRKIFAFYAYSDVHLEKVVTILTLEKKKKSKTDWSKQDKYYINNTSKYLYKNYAHTWRKFTSINYQKEYCLRYTSFCKVFKNKIIF